MYSNALKNFEQGAEKTIKSLKDSFNNIRAGRANPALLDNINVDYFGTPTPIKQVATISVPEARLLVIQPWDKSIIADIEKAILKSEIGITPSNDGDVVRLPFPALTEERRKELTKVARSESENAKVSIRNQRKSAIDEIKRLEKEEHMPEDQRKTGEKKLQDLVDKFNKRIDEEYEIKEKELIEF